MSEGNGMQKQVRCSRNADKFVVRLPDGMRERLQEVGRDNNRSMNSEIVARLYESLLNDPAGARITGESVVEGVQVKRTHTDWTPSVGNGVDHPTYGIGVIANIIMGSASIIAKVEFAGGVQRTVELYPACQLTPLVIKVRT